MRKTAILLAILLVGCDSEPPHYVFCSDLDPRGWKLISTAKDKDGYLVSCTYQSPDGRDAYTDQCTKDGCA